MDFRFVLPAARENDPESDRTMNWHLRSPWAALYWPWPEPPSTTSGTLPRDPLGYMHTTPHSAWSTWHMKERDSSCRRWKILSTPGLPLQGEDGLAYASGFDTAASLAPWASFGLLYAYHVSSNPALAP